MKIQSYSEIYPENLSELNADYEDDVSAITRSINQVGRNLNQLSSRNISLTDNILCDSRELVMRGGETLVIKNNFPTPPKMIWVGRVRLDKPSDPALTAAVQILDWSVDETNITVKSVIGLTAGQKYTISFVIFY